MTRRRIIAGVILLAAVAVAVPYAPKVWRTVAYRKQRIDGMVFLTRRWEWLPGRDVFVPNQVCSLCLKGVHNYCYQNYDAPDSPGVPIYLLRNGEISVGLTSPEFLKQRKGRPDSRGTTVSGYPSDWRCTCTDPSHDRD